ncbi:hypothetical protein JYK14_13630 [Siccirubricoccus sp. KC 17139]|uniref:Uncharacterized protein n=1 Tax=Siccirubricoccus soli TaxID=2899147 RepID=A0ABT1D5M4_9PROT|nr:hypothetical protein [Siccirubricoccus soli]MCO6417196.1 hypothetical protein [Siccirubricoccus soli]MCP2683331.1 hypothetical protein [Siccirubricoccus soli]
MRRLLLPSLTLCATLFAVPALSQTPPPAAGHAGGARPAPPSPGADRSGANAASPGAPTDLGPRSPEANQAHRGGGVVLEGAPGAPAPAPRPTPPAVPPAR